LAKGRIVISRGKKLDEKPYAHGKESIEKIVGARREGIFYLGKKAEEMHNSLLPEKQGPQHARRKGAQLTNREEGEGRASIFWEKEKYGERGERGNTNSSRQRALFRQDILLDRGCPLTIPREGEKVGRRGSNFPKSRGEKQLKKKKKLGKLLIDSGRGGRLDLVEIVLEKSQKEKMGPSVGLKDREKTIMIKERDKRMGETARGKESCGRKKGLAASISQARTTYERSPSPRNRS